MLNFTRLFLVTFFMLNISLEIDAQQDTLPKRKLIVNNNAESYTTFNGLKFYFQAQGNSDFEINQQLTWLNLKNTGTIRRARILFEHHLEEQKLAFYFQAGFSPMDLNGAYESQAIQNNPLLDAYAEWEFLKNTKLGFGQRLLPGNREGAMQGHTLSFVDRSLLSQQFTLDRDFGLFLNYKIKINEMIFSPEVAVTSGEGRNFANQNAGGLNYTFHLSFLPFGNFSKNGHQFTSDLYREEFPKVAFGVGYNINDNASRTHGQFGEFVNVERDLKTFFADVLVKYKGASFFAEFVDRFAPIPVVYDTAFNRIAVFNTGKAFNIQAGYLVLKNLEVTGRYTQILPTPVTLIPIVDQYTLGINHFMKDNLVKVQADFSYSITQFKPDPDFSARVLVQLGF